MADGFDAGTTFVGMPPEAPTSPGADGGTPASTSAPVDADAERRARKRDSDREAQRRSRAKRKPPQGTQAAPSSVKVEAPPPVSVQTPPLAQLLPAIATLYASTANDGRAYLLTTLREPMTGRTHAENIGAAIDGVLAFYKVEPTAEVVVWCNLALALGASGALFYRLPPLSVAEATAQAESLQQQLSGAAH